MAEAVALSAKEKKRLYNIEYRRKNLEREKKRYRLYYEQNKEKRSEYNIEYGKKRYALNRDEMNDASRERRLNNIDEHRRLGRERSRKFRVENQDLANARIARWAKKNPDKIRLYNSRRRTKLLNADGSHTADELKSVCLAQNNKCTVCFVKFGPSSPKALDHIVPLARGGSNWIENLQFLCRSCNSRKGARDPLEFARSVGRLL